MTLHRKEKGYKFISMAAHGILNVLKTSINIPKNSQQQKNDPKHNRRPES
jgi:hypothetical protein